MLRKETAITWEVPRRKITFSKDTGVLTGVRTTFPSGAHRGLESLIILAVP